MQNLDSVAQKMAELLIDATDTPFSNTKDYFCLHNLLGQSMQISMMKNLELAAQK